MHAVQVANYSRIVIFSVNLVVILLKGLRIAVFHLGELFLNIITYTVHIT